MDFDEEGNPLSMINFLYLTMDRISFGSVWKDEQGKYFFYRLLLNSWGDAQWLHVEKIEEDKSGNFKLVNRYQIREKDFDGNGCLNS